MRRSFCGLLILTGCLTLSGCSDSGMKEVEPSTGTETESAGQEMQASKMQEWLNQCNLPDVSQEEEVQKVDDIFYDIPIAEEEQKRLSEEAVNLALTYQDIYKNAEKGSALNGVISDQIRQEIIKRLAEGGHAVTDVYPTTNLENPERMQDFCEKLERGEEAEASAYKIYSNGGFLRLDFHGKDKNLDITMTALEWNASMEPIIPYIQKYQAYKWNFTEKGYLLYEKYTAEGSEMNGWNFIRIKPMEEELRALTQKYIRPMGYQGNNLFLIDWDETHMEELDFNDLFEYIYYLHYGKTTDEAVYQNGISKEEMEPLMEAHFPITAQWLEENAVYDPESQKYAWYPLGCGTISPQYIPFPEVVGMKQNEDGTITLTVDAVCPEYGTDQAFTHEVTVRDKEDGSFSYLSNHILPEGGNIIPSYEPRWRQAMRLQGK